MEKILPELNKEIVLKWFEKFPKLETFIGAGTISLKMSREILGIDRWLMYDIFCELVTAGAVTPSGSNGFRATPALQELLRERRSTGEVTTSK